MTLTYITPDAAGYCKALPQRARLNLHLPPNPDESRERRPPCALVLVIDRSASAAELSSEELTLGLLECLTILKPEDRLSLVTYSNNVHVVLPLDEPRQDSLLAAIDRLPPCSGVADPHFGWLAAINELKRCQDIQNRMVLILSPGGTTVDSYRLADLYLEYASAADAGYCTRILQPVLKSSTDSVSHAFELISMYGRGMTRRFDPAVEALSSPIISEVSTITSLTLQDVLVQIEASTGVSAQLHGLQPARQGWRLRNLGPGDKLKGLELTFSVAPAPTPFLPDEPERNVQIISGVFFVAPTDSTPSSEPAMRTLFKVTIRGKRFDGQECYIGSSFLELPLISYEHFVTQSINSHSLNVERESGLSGEEYFQVLEHKELRALNNRACILRAKRGILELALISFVIFHDGLLYVLFRLSPDSKLARENGSHDLVLATEGGSCYLHEPGSIYITQLGWEVYIKDEWVRKVRIALQKGVPKPDVMRQLMRWRRDAM